MEKSKEVLEEELKIAQDTLSECYRTIKNLRDDMDTLRESKNLSESILATLSEVSGYKQVKPYIVDKFRFGGVFIDPMSGDYIIRSRKI